MNPNIKHRLHQQSALIIRHGGVSLTILLVLLQAFSVTAQVISLDTVLATIDRQNPMLQEYDSKVKAWNAYAEGSSSWMAPMVGAGTFMTPYSRRMITDERDKGSIMFSVEQSIPNPAKQNLNRKVLIAKVDIEAQRRAFEFNGLRAEAKAVYYQWIVLANKMNVLKENDRILDLMLKLARIRYTYNQASLGSLYKAEGRQQEVQNMMLMTQGEIDEKQYRLKTLMNLDADKVIQIDTSYRVKFEPRQVLYDTATLGARRSDIQQLEKTIDVMRLNQQWQRAQAKPDFRLRFDHMQPLGDMPAQFTAMAMVSVPIAPWSSKMYKAEAKGMQYDIEAMKREREALLIETRGMLAGMATRIGRMQQQLDNYSTKIIPALRKNYQTLMLAYEENREQLPAVTEGWEALNMVHLEYLSKLDEYYSMIVTYEKELEK